MDPIQDPGGGLFGFFAWLLWKVYRFFPEGGFGFLLLALLLAVLVNVFFVPHLWRSVAKDIAYLAAGKVEKLESGGFNEYLLFLGLKTLTMLFLACLLHSAAGRTLVDGRQLFGFALSAPKGLLQAGLVVADVVIFGALVLLGGAVDDRDERLSRTTVAPYPGRSLADLYSQGGTYMNVQEADGKLSTTRTTLAGQFAWVDVLVVAATQVVYWFWSGGALVLFHCFLAAALLMELVRMLFVAIHHKRTFG